MPEAVATAERYWWAPVVRAVIAIVPGLAITFVPDHSAAFGFLLFGIWGIVSGAVMGALWLRQFAGTVRVLFVVNAVVTAVAGVTALLLIGAGLAFFLILVSTWAAIAGILELYAGLRERGILARSAAKSGSARDWIAVGVLTAVLAVVFLVLPPNDVVAVGLLGAYFVLIAVYLGIAGFSIKFDRRPAAEPVTDATPAPSETES